MHEYQRAPGDTGSPEVQSEHQVDQQYFLCSKPIISVSPALVITHCVSVPECEGGVACTAAVGCQPWHALQQQAFLNATDGTSYLL